MADKMISSISWGPNTRTYMFGTQIRYQADGSVHFYNPLVPSGIVLHSWSALQNYQASRSQPALPLLKKGTRYEVKAHLTSQPASGVFLKISFLDRYDNDISQLIEKSDHLIFTYPQEAYHYEIALVSAGVTEMVFQSLELREKEVGHADLD